MRRAADSVTHYERVAEKPWEHDFFQALRRIDCLNRNLPPLGTAVRPAQEAVRLGQEPALDFAPTVLSALHAGSELRPPRIDVRFLGLLGPNGPMPLHITDYARERLLHGGDATFASFMNVFNHRFISLFYRAWAQAQPTVTLDRPHEDRFAIYIGALFGLGSSRVRNRDAVQDAAKLFHVGSLARQVRNREGLESVLASYFKVPVRVQEFASHWLQLRERDLTRLGQCDSGVTLGRGAVLGARVSDRQHNITVHIGPLDLVQYESFLPGGSALARLVAWVRTYLTFEFDWDIRLVLQREQTPRMRLGQHGQLGWTSWLGQYTRNVDASDLRLDAERLTAGELHHA